MKRKNTDLIKSDKRQKNLFSFEFDKQPLKDIFETYIIFYLLEMNESEFSSLKGFYPQQFDVSWVPCLALVCKSLLKIVTDFFKTVLKYKVTLYAIYDCCIKREYINLLEFFKFQFIGGKRNTKALGEMFFCDAVNYGKTKSMVKIKEIYSINNVNFAFERAILSYTQKNINSDQLIEVSLKLKDWNMNSIYVFNEIQRKLVEIMNTSENLFVFFWGWMKQTGSKTLELEFTKQFMKHGLTDNLIEDDGIEEDGKTINSWLDDSD